MNTSIVLTIIADDQPGIIENVSNVLNKHGGNWTQSSMSSLAGQFAGILLASVPTEKAEDCLQALRDLDAGGMRIIAQACDGEPLEESGDRYSLDLVGNDHPGIIHDITSVLAAHKVSVHDLETVVESASMGGGELFRAKAQLVAPEGADIDALETELEDLANDLMVDIRFEK